ncbi:Dickkopf N-terminal cysteine-rich domain-containing protein [Streptomyces sp. NPDC056291]|jgi:hypothetical protein|uniref:Dickkopf N-terminal cysteine-rich domain-containing protein n=1 Tax=Streptomyces sp. NPDC056291 TaxID=3345772 RepID=UPI0035E32B98
MVTFTDDLTTHQVDAETIADLERQFTEVFVAPTACVNAGGACWFDSECCPGMFCSWLRCTQK